MGKPYNKKIKESSKREKKNEQQIEPDFNSNIDKEAKQQEHKRKQKILEHRNKILIWITYTIFVLFFIISLVYLFHILAPTHFRWLDRKTGLEKIELIFITMLVNFVISISLKKLKSESL